MRLSQEPFNFRDALAKLSQGHKLKCPYCPVEQNPADARQIFFWLLFKRHLCFVLNTCISITMWSFLFSCCKEYHCVYLHQELCMKANGDTQIFGFQLNIFVTNPLSLQKSYLLASVRSMPRKGWLKCKKELLVKMGRIFIQHMGGTRLFSCASCETVLTNRDELISTRYIHTFIPPHSLHVGSCHCHC